MEDVAVFPDHMKMLLVCVNRTYEAEGVYDAARYSWKISLAKAEQAAYVLPVAHGFIVGVFEPNEWLPAGKSNFPTVSDKHGNWERQSGRFGFVGRSASNDIALLIGKRIPTGWGFGGNPIRYVNF
jgi:hypothetical protein